MKVIITESQYKKILLEQTSPNKNCKVWVESKSDPKYIKYVSALNLCMRGKSIVDYFKQNPNATNVELNKKEVELEKKYHVSGKFDGFGSNYIKTISMAPVGTGSAARKAPQYSKPDKVCIKPKPLPKPLPTPFQFQNQSKHPKLHPNHYSQH